MTLLASHKSSRLPDGAVNVRPAELAELHTIWKDSGNGLKWRCLFTLPPWLTSWWKIFGEGEKSHSLVAEDDSGILGIAPLRIRNATAEFIGSPDVCDYLDVVMAPARQSGFARAVCGYLGRIGIRELVLNGVRKDAAVWTGLVSRAGASDWETECEREGVAFEIDLPQTWEEYLYRLPGKQRHELRRKLRRLQEAGDVRFRLVDAAAEVIDAFDVFIGLFKSSRPDKAAFMTVQMADFVRSLVGAFSGQNILKLGLLEIAGEVVSVVMCFDYRSTRYLYNSGYDPRYRSLSVGLLCKVYSIQDAIEKGLTRYDLLKGEEVYKQRLGGKPRDIYRCRIKLPQPGPCMKSFQRWG